MKTGKLTPLSVEILAQKTKKKSLFSIRISISGWLVFVLFSTVSSWLG